MAEEVERQGSTHVPGAADDGEGLPVVDALSATGGGGDLGLAHGFVGEDGEGERGVRVVISARVADCARVEPTLGPRLENPSPGRVSRGRIGTFVSVGGKEPRGTDACEDWKSPMVTLVRSEDSL